MFTKALKIVVIYCLLLSIITICKGQNTLPDVFKQGTITEQYNYLVNRTRIYENYRAIREDMFRAIHNNTVDTLDQTTNIIKELELNKKTLNHKIDSLNNTLGSTREELQQMTRTKNSIGVLGMEVGKITYNLIMWAIVGVLAFLLITGYLTFKQNRIITVRLKKELGELKAEFEAYREEKRLEREKLNINHFNEIQKLKGRR